MEMPAFGFPTEKRNMASTSGKYIFSVTGNSGSEYSVWIITMPEPKPQPIESIFLAYTARTQQAKSDKHCNRTDPDQTAASIRQSDTQSQLWFIPIRSVPAN